MYLIFILLNTASITARMAQAVPIMSENDMSSIVLSRQDANRTLIPANDPRWQTSPVVKTGTITEAQLAIWVAEGSTRKAKRDSMPTRKIEPWLNLDTSSYSGAASESLQHKKERDIPVIAETTRVFGNQQQSTAKETIIPGPFKMIETWAGTDTLNGMRLTDNNDVVVSVGTINTSSDTYKYFVFGAGEIIKQLRIWIVVSGGYERFTGFDFTTNLGNTFLCSFQHNPQDEIAVTRNAGGGFIYAVHASVVSNKIINFGVDMIAPIMKLEYDGMDFTDFVNGKLTLTNGQIVTAGRLLLDNRNTSVSQSAQLRLDQIETYARQLQTSWMTTAQVQQAFGVTVTAGLPVLSGTLSSTTTVMVQGQYGEQKQVTATTAIDYGAWGTIVCPAGKVCRAQASLTRWAGFSLNFVATMKTTTTAGAVWSWKNKGVYQGTDFADWVVTLGEYTVIPNS